METMTPKQKAIELTEKYQNIEFKAGNSFKNMDFERVKQFCLITINEIEKIVERYDYGQGERYDSEDYKYWQRVKDELLLL